MKIKKLSIYSLALLISFAIALGIWCYLPSKPLFKRVGFEQLPGWKSANLAKSLATFQVSCKAFISQDPNKEVGSEIINLQAKDWRPACYEALKINPVTEKSAKNFFYKWFVPLAFYDKKAPPGLFTGYYMPLVKGSFRRSEAFNVPLYELPKDLVTANLQLFSPDLKSPKSLIGRLEGSQIVPYYTRAQIRKGAIKNTAKVLVWVHSPVDRLFLEIQGSGIIELEDGKKMYIGYNGQNGRPYTSIAGVLIKKGVMTKQNASMQGIRQYLQDHPAEMDEVMNHNQSFIFFRQLSLNAALGSQGVALTPGYSLAIDKQWIPLGLPLWLSTSRPDSTDAAISKPFQRLMVAQDTGGAIKGKVRGDVFWGGGNKATFIAGHMKNEGRYWLLLPRSALSKLNQQPGHRSSVF